MSNIFGDPFDPFVKTQIETRQKSLGENTSISAKDLQYYNSKTPWLRLASAVDLTFDPDSKGDSVDRLKALGFPVDTMDGYDLARNCVLFGGVTSLAGDDEGTTGFKFNKGVRFQEGVSKDGVLNLDGAYGWGGTISSDRAGGRGPIPMPGITDASVQYYNNGALAKAIINIRCFSKEQFAIIDALYMRPGFNLLLEFGWSMYLNNEGQLENYDTFYTEPFEYLFNPDSTTENTHFTMYDKILTERKERVGNYNGVFGKISKFSWDFAPDGTYSIQVTVQGYGDMMESLKVNIPRVKTGDKAENLVSISSQALNTAVSSGAGTEALDVPLLANSTKTLLNFELYKIYGKAFSQEGSGFIDYDIESFADPNDNYKRKKLTIPKGILSLKGTATDALPELIQSPQVYISLGTFLAIIQDKLLVYDDNNGKNTPLFKFDFDFFNIKEDDNYYSTIPGLFSADPLTCLVDLKNVQEDIIKKVTSDSPSILITPIGKIMDEVAELHDVTGETYVKRMAYIYININFIANSLQGLVTANAEGDNDGSISLLALLNNTLRGVEQSLGNYPLFSVRYDEDINSIKILDFTPQRFSENKSGGEYTLLNTFGVKPGVEGSFVKNISLNSELSNEFASLITIAAQANSTQLGANSTSFSKYNAGLVDRIIPTKVNFGPGNQEPEKTITQHWNENMNNSSNSEDTNAKLFESIYAGNLLTENIQALKEHNTTFIQLLSGILTKERQIQAPFFLPFNLKLDLEGISGMKLYQKFVVDDSILPPSYERDSVDIQVKSIGHTITDSDWTTSIETIATPRSQLDGIVKPSPQTSTSTQQLGSGGINSGGSGNLQPPPGENPPEDEKLRIRHYRIMDDGTQTLGYYEVLDENGQLLYRLATSELPYLGNQNNISAIPVDKYRVKSHVSGKHGKCFWIIGNEMGNYAYNKLYGNGYIRGAVLIHRAPKAVGWLMGCQAPGFYFNTQGNQKGRQQGTGDKYLNPSAAQSQQAVDKLLGTLYDVGSWRMTVENKFDPLPTSFEDEKVQNLIKQLQLVP